MNDFSQNGQDFYVHEDVFRLKEEFQIRKTAKQVGLSYLLLIFMPDLLRIVLGWIDRLVGGGLIDFISKDPAGMQLYQIIGSIIIFTLPFGLLVAVAKKRVGVVMNFGPPKKGTLLPFTLMGLGFCAFANLCTAALGSLAETFGFALTQPDGKSPEGVFGVVLVVVASAVTPALAEEFAMRGAVLGATRLHGESFALLISATLFGLMHGNFVQIPFAFVVGLAVGFAVIKSGSMWTAVLIHFLNNFLSVCLDYFTEGMKDTVSSAVVMIYFALCFVCFFVGLLLIKDREDWKLTEPEGVLTFGGRIKAFFTSPYIIASVVISLLTSLSYVVVI